jgi:hypothetical protein
MDARIASTIRISRATFTGLSNDLPESSHRITIPPVQAVFIAMLLAAGHDWHLLEGTKASSQSTTRKTPNSGQRILIMAWYADVCPTPVSWPLIPTPRRCSVPAMLTRKSIAWG